MGSRLIRAAALSAVAGGVGKLASLVLNVVASLALIRYLGPAGYGDYVFAFSFATLLGLASDLGLGKMAVREMSRVPEGSAGSATAEAELLGTALATRVVLAVGCWLIAQAALWATGAPPQFRVVVAIAALTLVTDALLTVTALYQARLVMQYDALVAVVIQAIDTVLILALIWARQPLLVILAVPTLAGGLGAALAIVLAVRRLHAHFRLAVRRVPYLVREALPLGLATTLAVLYLKLDAVLLAFLAGPRDVGLYGAAYKPIEYLLLSTAVLVNPLFPLLARWWVSDPSRFAALYRRGTEIVLAFALPASVLLIGVAQPMVESAYASPYRPSAVPLSLLAAALPLMVLNGWQGFVLLAAGRQRVTLAYDAGGLVVNVALNLALIPRFGYMGAATAAAATALCITICSTLACARLVGRPAALGVARVGAAAGGLGLVLTLAGVAGLNWLVGAVLAAAAYLPLVLLMGVARPAELRALLPVRRTAPIPVAP